MSFNGITVLGLVSGEHIIEDLRIRVPYRVAVQISAEQANRSRDLGRALQDKKILQIQGSLPAGAVFRGLGAVPRPAAPIGEKRRPVVTEMDASKVQELQNEISRLNMELEASKKREGELQNLNKGLQTTLSTMSTQLQTIQDVLQDLKSHGIHVTQGVSGGVRVDVDEDVPMFIPESFRQEGARVNISVKEKTQEAAGVAASRSALRSLRKGKQ